MGSFGFPAADDSSNVERGYFPPYRFASRGKTLSCADPSRGLVGMLLFDAKRSQKVKIGSLEQ